MEALAVAVPVGPELDGVAGTLTRAGARLIRYASDAEQSSGPLEAWLNGLIEGRYDDVLFSSGQAVRLIVELARQLDREDAVIEALRRVRKLAAGAKARAVLQEYGLRAEIVAESRDPESLALGLQGTSLVGRVVAIAQLSPDRGVVELLEAKGARPCGIESLALPVDPSLPRLGELLLGGELDLVILDKGSELSAAWRMAEGRRQLAELRQALAGTRVVALSESAADLVRRRGVRVDAVIDARSVEAGAVGLARAAGLLPDGADTESRLKAARGASKPETIVVVGNGMVGHRFCERLREYDKEGRYRAVVFCEEPRTAYDRVRLTSYFETLDPQKLEIADPAWYKRAGIRVLLGERATKLDRKRRALLSSSGEWVHYDYAVLSTGSVPWVPPVPGMNKAGVFVYRTIDDLERIAAYAAGKRRAIVLGGGLLGLEAAKALLDLGLETHVVETAPRLMPRQLDTAGARLLEKLVRALGVRVHLSRSIVAVQGERQVEGIDLHDGEQIEADLIVACAGIRPRDELARDARLKIGDRGGIVVDDALRTSDERVFAIGECALHRNVCYGLVGPGYEMADVLAKNLCGQGASYAGSDQSAKLKLLGVDVASFGDPFLEPPQARTIVYEDLVKGVYKKLVLSEDGRRLLGGVLVGDAGEYPELCTVFRAAGEVPAQPEQLILGKRGGGSAEITLSDTAQICSCNGVTKGEILTAVRDGGCSSVAELKKCTKAGSGCGGCVPLVTDILNAELRAAGKATQNHLCEHFEYSRRELYEIVKINRVRKFEQLLESHGSGSGCEVCKPAVASILASVFNEPILNHETLQDTNDRFLANLQRTGLYSVVPRVPGGEITPEKLIKLGEVAKKYGLYTKITGGQRIDMFGATVAQLPDIWAELVAAGFESGHAYGKAMRTVKSCVGSTWCRFGVQDSVAFAIRIENRYKGVRAPHKLKSAVSGCIRECAEAQSKDFGVIATERGWNVYVCGNGGAKPRHADLLAQDLDEDTVIRYLDRFLMYYIRTADKLTRTSTWLDKLDGGIEYLRQVIVHDRLGICEQLEKEMQFLVDTYTCEWAEVVNDPARRAHFQHFANSSEPDDSIDLVSERGQRRPVEWPPRPVAEIAKRRLPVVMTSWVKVARAADVPKDGGIAIKYGKSQIALFNFASRGEWYACQNMCPHTGDMVLARGIVGDQAGRPKVACPMHKKTFSLESGECLSGESYGVLTFPVRVEDGSVWLELPPAAELEAEIGREARARACAEEACAARAGAA